MLRVRLINGDFPPGGPVLCTGMDSAASAMHDTLATQQGEWAFDFLFGMRWRGAVLRKFFDAAATRSFVAADLNTVPDPEPISPAQIDIDTTSQADLRQVNITVNDVTVDGEQVDLTFSTAL